MSEKMLGLSGGGSFNVGVWDSKEHGSGDALSTGWGDGCSNGFIGGGTKSDDTWV